MSKKSDEPTCARCNKSILEVRLFDVVGRAEIIKMCEECAKLEGVPIIRKPNTFQLKDAEKNYTVYERLAQAAGLQDRVPKDKIRITNEKKKVSKDITLADLREAKKNRGIKKSIKRATEPYPQLIDNFHWILKRARVSKKITRKQLANAIGESEAAIKMAEQADLPDDFPILIKKLETYFEIKLIKEEERYKFKDIDERKSPARILSFDKNTIDNLTIGDLKRIKKQKEKIGNGDERNIDKMIWGKTSDYEEGKEESNNDKNKESDEQGVIRDVRNEGEYNEMADDEIELKREEDKTL